MKILAQIYFIFLYLYPAAFRDEFAAEMRIVFLEALDAAAAAGKSPFRLLLHEIADLPSSLLRLHWLSGDLLPSDEPVTDPWASLPGTRRAAFLAGFPHFLFALSIYLPAATAAFFGLDPTDRPAQFPFWTLTAFLLVFAWSRGWPRWSSSWIGFGLVFLLDRITSAALSGLLAYLLITVWSVLAVFILLQRARRDWLSGLLIVLPIAPMWVWRIGINGPYAVLSKAMLFTSIGLMVSLVVVAIVRAGRWQTAVLLILAMLLAVGPTVSPVDIFSYNLVSPARSYLATSPDDWVGNYLLLIFMTAPLWLLAFWRRARKNCLSN